MAAAILCFFSNRENTARWIAISFSFAILAVSLVSLGYTEETFRSYNYVSYYWLKYIGNSFFLGIDATGRLMTLLTAVSMPLVLLSTFRYSFRNPNIFFGLLMLAQCGLMGVFCAMDALLFYFFWELALIPVYFLCSFWGGPRRIPVTFKFFIYTFVGSLMMLAGIIYIYFHTPGRVFEDGTVANHSFSYSAFLSSGLSFPEQAWLSLLFFLAFAIKMPVFPFHTWQPDTYDQSPTPVTMVLSGVMVKMGLFGVIRWLLPLFPLAWEKFAWIAVLLSIAGIVYASLLAIVQDNIRKMVAYSSIAHIGLMAALLFTRNETGVQGAMMQMFNHAVNIIGLWIVVGILEQKTGVKHISQLSGAANRAPWLTAFLVLIALANVALPLTNAFAGEMLMFAGLFAYKKWFAAIAGLSIIFAAIYMLNMIRRVFFGNVNAVTEQMGDISKSEWVVLTLVAAIILVTGFYPESILGLGREAAAALLQTKV